MSRVLRCTIPVGFVFLFGACSGNPPTTATPDKVPSTKPDTSAEPATPEPAASGGTDAGQPEAATGPKVLKGASGRVVPTYTGTNQPTTVGTDGAVFRTDDGAELRIPTGWFREPRNVLFVIDRKGRATTGKIGNLYEIHVQRPDIQYTIGAESPSETIQSMSDPFVLKLPLPGGTNSANLAVETLIADPKSKKPKSTWAVAGMSKLETADSGNKAVFEITLLPDGHVHLTTSAPTGGAGPTE